MRSAGACWASAALLGAVLALAAPGAGETPALGLDELLERMRTSRGVAARFHEHKELALLTRPLETRGVLYFVPPDRLARFASEPAPSALLVEGERLRFREEPGAEELDLSASPVARAFAENLLALWSGDRERLEERYRPALSTSGADWSLELVPRRAPLSRFLARVVLAGDDTGMHEIVVHEVDGDLTRTTLDRVERDRAFSEEELERLFRDGLPLDDAP